MASKFIIKIALTSLILALYVLTPLSPVFAASSVEETLIKEHVVKFYLDPALAADMEYAKVLLPKYVADMNTILGKNTNRRLVFDPETGIIITSTKPHTDSARPPLPTQGFEIWVHAVQTDRQTSYGGYAGVDISGAGVLAGLKWTRLYDPENLDGTNLFDYSVQLNNMLHELAHVFGAGIGEYYSLANVTDTTNTAPLLNIKLSDPQDTFWSDKRDFIRDPLLQITRADTRSAYLETVQFSNLTAAIINGDYRNGLTSFENYTVQVLDESGQPLAGANVKVWSIYNTSELVFDGTTDENGQITLVWGGTGDPHNANNLLRLIKVYKDDAPVAQPRYISIFDADIAKLVMQNDAHIVSFRATPPQPEPGANKTDTFNSIGRQDGWVLKSKNSNSGKQNNTATTFNLGDDAANRQYRGILHFDTSSLPDNAVIVSATLKLKKQGLVGTNPFDTHGSLLVDIRKKFFGVKTGLEIGDFQATPTKSSVAEFSNVPVDNWYSAILDEIGKSRINLMGATQFRLRFTISDNNDNGADFIKFFSGNASSLDRPQLIIEYYVP